MLITRAGDAHGRRTGWDVVGHDSVRADQRTITDANLADAAAASAEHHRIADDWCQVRPLRPPPVSSYSHALLDDHPHPAPLPDL